MSVVIPTYGRPENVLEAVESVAEQTYDRVELVVVDDCSPDPIVPDIDSLNTAAFERIECVRHETNRGAAAARCTGIERASGEFVAFLDDDDRWKPCKLRRQVDAMEEWGDDAGVAYCGMRIVDDQQVEQRRHTPSKSGDLTRTLLCRNIVGSYSTVMVRQRAIEETGLPDERFPSWQDLEWYIRLSKNWDFVAVPDPRTIIYQDETHEQISDNFQTIESETYSLFLETFRPLAAQYGRTFERKMLAWAAFRVGGYNALRTGHFAAARRYLFRAVVRYPAEPIFWLYFLISLGGSPVYNISKRLKRMVSA